MTFTHGLSTNNYGPAKFIVDASAADGTHTTIAAALAVASSGDTIFVRDGTYTENLTLVAGVSIVGFSSETAIIVGKCTATFAGTCYFSNISLQTNGDFTLVVSGTLATIVKLSRCDLVCSDNTGISHTSSSSSSTVALNRCKGSTGTTGIAFFASTSAGNMEVNYTRLTNGGGSSTASTFGGTGTLNMKHTGFSGVLTTSSTSSVYIFTTFFFTQPQNVVALNAGNTITRVTHSWFDSGTSAAIAVSGTLAINYCSIRSTNATAVINGAGSITYSGINFRETGNIITTSTQTPRVNAIGAIQVTIPSSWPYTATPQDGVICIDSSGAARGVTLPSSPSTGMHLVIKDFDGNAATNNITITPAAGNIDGSSTYVMNLNYGSITLVYNGTEWSII